MRNHEVYSGYLILQRVAKVQLKDVAVRNRLLTIRRVLRPIAQAIEEEQKTILTRHGDADLVIPKENQVACNRELNAILSASVEDPPTLPEPLQLEDIEVNGLMLSVADAETLMALGIVVELSENGNETER